MLTKVFENSKKAESDNITIFVFTVLVLIGGFYAADWFMGGALIDVTGAIYHKTFGALGNPLKSLTSNSQELNPACKEEFKCNYPGNETACANQLLEYNELCGIK